MVAGPTVTPPAGCQATGVTASLDSHGIWSKPVAHLDVEKRYLRKDGRIVWGRTTVNVVVRDGFGRPVRNVAVIQDITVDEKQAEGDLEAGKPAEVERS